MAAPIEKKVQVASAASAAVSLAMWALGRYVFKGAVPDVVSSWMYAIVPGALTFAAGYFARHTPRPSDPPVAVVPPDPPIPPAG